MKGGVQMIESEKTNTKRVIERDRANGYLIPRGGCSSYHYLSYLHTIDISLRRIADALEDLSEKEK